LEGKKGRKKKRKRKKKDLLIFPLVY